MTVLFTAVFNMSITASYVIIAILLIRLIIFKLPKKYSYILWSVVAFRLAIPISFKSVFSLFSLDVFDMTGVSNSEMGTLEYMEPYMPELSRVPKVDIGIANTYNTVQELTVEPPYCSASRVMIFQEVFSYIWLGVMIFLLLYGVISYIVLRTKMANAVLRQDNIYESDKISSPFILGLVFPKIYIPFGLDEKTYGYVISHEKCHIARLDYYVKALAYILLAVHWFNPLCWLAFVLMSRDMEMSCDEKVLCENPDIKKEYSTALLSFAIKGNNINITPLCFSENGVKSRIKNVLKFRKPKLFISIIVAVLCVAVVLGCATNPDFKNINFVDDSDRISYVYDKGIGATVPYILYADDSEAVLYGSGDLIIYDYALRKITDIVTYETIINLGFDDYYNEAFVTSDGQRVYFVDGVTGKNGQYKTYCYNRRNKTIKKVHSLPDDIFKPVLIENLPESEYSQLFNTDDYINSTQCAVIDGNLLYTRTDKERTTNSLELVIADTAENRLTKFYRIFANVYNYDSMSNDEIASLIDIICSSPAHSSAPGDYINAHQSEFNQLLNNPSTIDYVFSKFLNGGNYNLEGHIMKALLDGIAVNESIGVTYETAQDYFDAFYANNVECYKEDGLEYLQKNKPYGYKLLNMRGSLINNKLVDGADYLPVLESDLKFSAEQALQSGNIAGALQSLTGCVFEGDIGSGRYIYAFSYDNDVSFTYSPDQNSFSILYKGEIYSSFSLMQTVADYSGLNIISADDAVKIAREEITKTKYDMYVSDVDEGVFKNYDLNKSNEPVLYKNPYVDDNSSFVYETEPEYVWAFYLTKNGEESGSPFYVYAYVNAQTGTVSKISIEFND